MVNIETGKEEDILIIKVAGEIDASSSIFLDEAIKNALAEDNARILIDCQDLNYISSAGLGVFMSYIEELNSRKVQLILFGLNSKVLNVFQILGLDQLLKIVDSREGAKVLFDAV